MIPVDQRAQVLANCRYLYGPDIDIVTVSCGGSDGDLYQAVAMKFDPLTASWTRFLYSSDEAKTSGRAIGWLLYETERIIADLFATNGWSVPLTGDHFQTMTLHRAPSPPTANSYRQSQKSTLEAPNLKSQKDAVLEEETIHVESVTLQTNVEIDSAQCELPQEETLLAKETPNPSCAVVDGDAPIQEDDWRVLRAKIDKKVKKKGHAAVEEPEPGLEPEPATIEDDKWGLFSTKKDKKKKKKDYAAVDEPEPQIGPTIIEEPEPAFESEPALIEDDEWGVFSPKKNKKKKRKASAFIEKPEPQIEPTIVEESISQIGLEPAPFEDDGWEGFGVSKKDKKRKSRIVIGKPILEDTRLPDLEPEPQTVGEDDGLETSERDQKNNRQPIVKDIPKMDVTIDQIPVDKLQAPSSLKAKKPSTTSASLSQTAITNTTSQSPVIMTVVLKIVHISKAGTQTLRTMVNLAENTPKAILNAVNQYLDHSSDARYLSSCRIIDIKFGSGKDGDIDLSALEESRWPEYLEYLSQYTQFPELTIHASD